MPVLVLLAERDRFNQAEKRKSWGSPTVAVPGIKQTPRVGLKRPGRALDLPETLVSRSILYFAPLLYPLLLPRSRNPCAFGKIVNGQASGGDCV